VASGLKEDLKQNTAKIQSNLLGIMRNAVVRAEKMYMTNQSTNER